ncbi:hypothetical protein GQ457_08G010550 [Hibiscus cannabinus]
MKLGASHRDHDTHSSGGGSREDCRSDGATSTLIEAWGNRYLRLNRGNLRRKDWQEVADAINNLNLFDFCYSNLELMDCPSIYI